MIKIKMKFIFMHQKIIEKDEWVNSGDRFNLTYKNEQSHYFLLYFMMHSIYQFMNIFCRRPAMCWVFSCCQCYEMFQPSCARLWVCASMDYFLEVPRLRVNTSVFEIILTSKISIRATAAELPSISCDVTRDYHILFGDMLHYLLGVKSIIVI